MHLLFRGFLCPVRTLGGQTSYRLTSSKGTRLSSSYKGAVFLGTDDFSLPSLQTLSDLLGPSKVTVVVSSLSSGVVAAHAKRTGLKIFTWEDFKKLGGQSSSGGGEWDFGVVASFGYLIPKKIIDIFPLGILNVHGSLLPRWRGASPIEHAIMAGDKVTGISIMRIAPFKFDVGPVLLRKEIPLDPHIRMPEVRTLLAKLGATALKEVLSDRTSLTPEHIRALPQDNREATLAPKLTPEMNRIASWGEVSTTEVYNKFRALGRLRSFFNGKDIALDEIGLVKKVPATHDELKKDSIELSDGLGYAGGYYGYKVLEEVAERLLEGDSPGRVVYDKNKNLLCICCGGSEWVFARKIRLGQKWMSAKDFQNGFISKVGGSRKVHFNGSDNLSIETNNSKENKKISSLTYTGWLSS